MYIIFLVLSPLHTVDVAPFQWPYDSTILLGNFGRLTVICLFCTNTMFAVGLSNIMALFQYPKGLVVWIEVLLLVLARLDLCHLLEVFMVLRLS